MNFFQRKAFLRNFARNLAYWLLKNKKDVVEDLSNGLFRNGKSLEGKWFPSLQSTDSPESYAAELIAYVVVTPGIKRTFNVDDKMIGIIASRVFGFQGDDATAQFEDALKKFQDRETRSFAFDRSYPVIFSALIHLAVIQHFAHNQLWSSTYFYE